MPVTPAFIPITPQTHGRTLPRTVTMSNRKSLAALMAQSPIALRSKESSRLDASDAYSDASTYRSDALRDGNVGTDNVNEDIEPERRVSTLSASSASSGEAMTDAKVRDYFLKLERPIERIDLPVPINKDTVGGFGSQGLLDHHANSWLGLEEDTSYSYLIKTVNGYNEYKSKEKLNNVLSCLSLWIDSQHDSNKTWMSKISSVSSSLFLSNVSYQKVSQWMFGGTDFFDFVQPSENGISITEQITSLLDSISLTLKGRIIDRELYRGYRTLLGKFDKTPNSHKKRLAFDAFKRLERQMDRSSSYYARRLFRRADSVAEPLADEKFNTPRRLSSTVDQLPGALGLDFLSRSSVKTLSNRKYLLGGK